MKALKIVGLTLIGLVLFLSLSVFGTALTINSTLLNPRFLPDELDRLDVAALVEETVLDGSSTLTADTRAALVKAVETAQPQVKAQVRAANSQVYDYLLGRQESLDLRQVLKSTVLNGSFVSSLLSEPDTIAVIRQNLRDELAALIPSEQQSLAVYLDDAMPSLDPWIREQINIVTSPAIDYLLGETPNLRVVLSLEPMKSILRTSARDAFLKSPPLILAGSSQSELNTLFNEYYDLFAAEIPNTEVIDPSSLGIGPSVSIGDGLDQGEAGLADARTAISYFRTYFVVLIILILTLILAMIFIHREVKWASRDLGILFATYGVIELIGVLVGGYFISNVNMSDLPAAVQSWIPGLYWDFSRPLIILSAVLAVVGAGLIVLSFLYRRRTSEGVVGPNDEP